MQHRACAARAHDRQVQRRLRRRLARAAGDAARPVDFDDIPRFEKPFVYAASRDGEPERIAADDGAEIAARAEHPAPHVEVASDVSKLPCQSFEAGHTSTISPRPTSTTSTISLSRATRPGIAQTTSRLAHARCVSPR